MGAGPHKWNLAQDRGDTSMPARVDFTMVGRNNYDRVRVHLYHERK
jgi:hypothetical protein